MNKPTFSPTHRVLVDAAIEHGYNMIDIDIVSGTFRKNEVNKKETKIRVLQDILAEKLCYNGGNDYNQPLTNKEAINIGIKFNKKREELGYKPLSFLRVEVAHAKSL